MRDHGGDLDRARKMYGAGPWLDLSTGINPVPYPVPDIAPGAWANLPTRAELGALEEAARQAYGAQSAPVALAGAQAAIQLVPRLRPPGRAHVLAPSYNEHAASLRAQGWHVVAAQDPEAMHGADLAVIVNPNNPDGRMWPVDHLRALAGHVGLLVVDESFTDPGPEASLVPHVGSGLANVVIQRSFGKFYGLAGLRLGFVVAAEALAQQVRALCGPWAVNGPAIAVGRQALSDTAWQDATRARLAQDAARLDTLARAAGLRLIGGTPLFRTYACADAAALQDHLARAFIWTRVFPYNPNWIRLGLPGSDDGWQQLTTALGRVR